MRFGNVFSSIIIVIDFLRGYNKMKNPLTHNESMGYLFEFVCVK